MAFIPAKSTDGTDAGQDAAVRKGTPQIKPDSPMEDVKYTSFSKEAELCDLFIREMNALDGWRCYPETGGFDVLVVHDDGRQIGVEAKLRLNAKVAQQALPKLKADFWGSPGPDYRLVIVAKLTDGGEGIATMLEMLGVKVIYPQIRRTKRGDEYSFGTFSQILEAKGHEATYGYQYMFDWNPAERCALPSVLQNLPAGVPSPVRITPWKESAIKVIALMRQQGFITAKQIAEHGIGTTLWTQPQPSKNGWQPAWLAKGAQRGQWVETENMPPFDKQHPALYELAVKALEDSREPLLV